MASRSSSVATALFLLLVVLAQCFSSQRIVEAQETDHSNTSSGEEATLGWPLSSLTPKDTGEDDEYESEQGRILVSRRTARHHGRHHYISYAVLSEDYVPCSPGSGRSYYTNNCHKASGPVHPYSRGCSCISHCRR